MATTMAPLTVSGARTRVEPVGGLRFDWVVTVLNLFLAGGLFLDTWAHVHVPGLETFFTPWHAVLYAGFGAVSFALVGAVLRNRGRGREWGEAVPAGYGWSVLGVPLFLLGGVGDLLWHTFLGIEVGVEASLSPTHLLLAASLLLFFVGPFRAAVERDGGPRRQGGAALLPAVIGFGLVVALFSTFTDYANPFTYTSLAASFDPRLGLPPAVGAELGELVIGSGIAGMLIQAALLTGATLTLVRRWTLPPGAVTLLVALPVTAVGLAYAALLATGPLPPIVAGLVAGVIADLLLRRLRPSTARPGALRLFAFALPALVSGCYVASVALVDGVWWSVHVWSGAIVLSGVAGVLVSFLVVPARSDAAAGVDGHA